MRELVRRFSVVSFFLGGLLLTSGPALAAATPPESTCYGSAADGRLENGWKLPLDGPNFETYSVLGSTAGRTYVHSRVHRTLLAAYAALAETLPDTVFMYGETGFEEGGPFEPHKTHRNGLSVDHMVPVLDADGGSVPLPTSVFNKLGYAIEFDGQGRYEDLRIDAEALAELIHQLHRAAAAEGIGIRRVIFAPDLQPLLHGTKRWPELRKNVRFSTKPSWVRHDEHIHVDFVVDCR